MHPIKIHQIYYSADTRHGLDAGFMPLDNMRNQRPDWREYWPIRNYLQSRSLDPAAFYGFFSPKFGSKTLLDSRAVIDFVARRSSDADVILFSPFFDQMAYPINIFEQGAMQHADTMPVFRDCALMVAPDIDFDGLVMSSTNTVFCNFFVARATFWEAWLDICESIFRLAEEGKTDLARKLNANTGHDGGGVPRKVFVIERIASLMLAAGTQWRARAYNPFALPWSGARIANFRLEMAFLDALKVAYLKEGHPQYLDAFHRLRQVVNQWLSAPSPEG